MRLTGSYSSPGDKLSPTLPPSTVEERDGLRVVLQTGDFRMGRDARRISRSLFQVAPDSSAMTNERPRSTSSGGPESSMNFARLPTEPLGDEWQGRPLRRPPR